MLDILGFLIRAKKNTYANGDSAKVRSSRLASKDYHYEEVVGGVENLFITILILVVKNL